MAGRSMLCFALLVSLLAAGCGTQASYRGKSLMKLQVGMTKEEVLSIMGKPQRHETPGTLRSCSIPRETPETQSRTRRRSR
jgi:outer membrane protein assembly factor BamE (lipoprotein component of BamABCDE complex)